MKGIKEQFKLALSSNGLANHRNELFEDIWKEYYPGLKMFCRTYLSESSDLDDVCQDIMLKVFNKLHTIIHSIPLIPGSIQLPAIIVSII